MRDTGRKQGLGRLQKKPFFGDFLDLDAHFGSKLTMLTAFGQLLSFEAAERIVVKQAATFGRGEWKRIQGGIYRPSSCTAEFATAAFLPGIHLGLKSWESRQG